MATGSKVAKKLGTVSNPQEPHVWGLNHPGRNISCSTEYSKARLGDKENPPEEERLHRAREGTGEDRGSAGKNVAKARGRCIKEKEAALLSLTTPRPSGDREEEGGSIFSMLFPPCKGKQACSLVGTSQITKVVRVQTKVN